MLNWAKLALTLGLCACSGLLFQPAHAQTTDKKSAQTQDELKKLNAKIQNLQKLLSQANNKRLTLNKELANTEKKISGNVMELRRLQANIQSKEQDMIKLQQQLGSLDQQLKQQQQRLAQHARARYQMGDQQPLKWLLNQDDPARLNRLLTYYQYLVKSDQQLISGIGDTLKKQENHSKALQTALEEAQGLQTTLKNHQQQLLQNKTYRSSLLKALNQDIQNTGQRLTSATRDKERLSRLLESLAQQSINAKQKPFQQMRKKLPYPVQIKPGALQKMNQGLSFFALEGSLVTAVYPGQVVFCDWLNGYGLLLILDHGQGFMTLYAHNESLFAQKGQWVNQNEPIASVGHSGGIKQNGLYFEIRHRGKAIPPLEWFSG